MNWRIETKMYDVVMYDVLLYYRIVELELKFVVLYALFLQTVKWTKTPDYYPSPEIQILKLWSDPFIGIPVQLDQKLSTDHLWWRQFHYTHAPLGMTWFHSEMFSLQGNYSSSPQWRRPKRTKISVSLTLWEVTWGRMRFPNSGNWPFLLRNTEISY